MLEKRMYIVVSSDIDVPETGNSFEMSCGRNIAQACHVAQRLALMLRLDPDLEVTKVILKVANSKELEAIRAKIIRSNVDWAEFRDTNLEVYLTKKSLLTAVAAYCSRKKGKSLFFGLNSWRCDVQS